MQGKTLNKILIFVTRQLCYCSASFFAARLGDAFESLGYECTICEIDESITQQDMVRLETFIGESFLAVIDFNSKLPRMVLEDNSYYLDHINAPFYNYILDNPLYHHETLSCKLNDYHVLMVDENHCRYVIQHYSHIKSVHMLALGACEAIKKHALQEKEENILFMGTYRDPDQYYTQINDSNEPWKQTMQEMLKTMMADTTLTMEQALKQVLYAQGKMLNEPQFAETMNRCYPVELFLRNYHRKKLLDTVIAAGLPVKIVGEWWEEYPLIHRNNVQYHKGVSFARSFDQIAKSVILLDSSPFFKGGIHDRVFAGMANRTVVFTDGNPYKEKYLLEASMRQRQRSSMSATAFQTYNLHNLSKISEELVYYLTNKKQRDLTVEDAYQTYLKEHTWVAVAQRFLEEIP